MWSGNIFILADFSSVGHGYYFYYAKQYTRQIHSLPFALAKTSMSFNIQKSSIFQMSYILTIALVTVIAAAFDLPTYTYGKNLQAFVVILLCYGCVIMVAGSSPSFGTSPQPFSAIDAIATKPSKVT